MNCAESTWLECRTVFVLFVAMETETRTSAIIIEVIQRNLAIDEARRILRTVDLNFCSRVPPVKPNGGQIFIFKADSLDKQGEHMHFPSLRQPNVTRLW